MRPPRSLDVRELTQNELATILWNSPCPVARQTVLDEMKARQDLSSRLLVSNDVE